MAAGFALTPHKLSMCVLLQLYAAPPALSPPFPLPAAVRHQLALFLLGLAKASDGFLEPTLEDLGMQLKAAIGSVGEVIAEQLASRLLGFSSPEDLFTFVVQGLREIVVPAPYTIPERGSNEDTLLVEQNSPLGQFLRRCILSFNILSFEGTCRLLAELDAYRRPALAATEGSIVAKESFLNRHADDDDEDDDDEEIDEDLEDDEDENVTASVTPIHSRDRHGNGRRAFGVPLIPTEGSEELELQEFTDAQELEGFGANHTGNGGGVRDGGFAFAFGDAASRGEHATQGSFLRTYGQVESFMKDQAILIAKGLGTTSKDVLDAKLNHIEKLAPDMHRVHYLQYLNSIHHGDYPDAMSRLHQYFDYSAGRGNGAVGIDASVGRFQAGLLTLGSMHAHFGHVTQALQALSETVRIAQQNNDDTCLAHSLAALCHLLSEVGVAAEVTKAGAIGEFDRSIGPQLAAQQHLLLCLKRCLKRSLELKLPDLVAFSRLSLAKFDLQHVRRLPSIGGLRSSEHLGTSPVDVCKTLRLSPFLLGDLVHSMSSQRTAAGGFGAQAGLTGNLQTGRLGPLSESLLKLAGSSHLLRACSWELYGSDPMMRVSSLVHAYCYSRSSSADDMSVAYVKLAHHLAEHKGYEVALVALEQTMKKFPLHARTSLRSAQLQFVHSQALNRGNIKLAWVACSEIAAMASPVLGVDMELKFEASYRHALTLLACRNYSQAATSAGDLFALCYKYDMQIHVVKVLLLIAEIHKKAGSAVTGLPYVLGSITLCQSLNLDLLHAASRVSLAELWLKLGSDHAQRALDLLQQSLPIVLGHGGLELRARTNLCIARCYLNSPDFSVESTPELVLEPLQLAAEEFMTLEDKEEASEAFYLLAITYNSINRLDERDKAAEKFQECVEYEP